MMEMPAFFQPDPNASSLINPTEKTPKNNQHNAKPIAPGGDDPKALIQYYEKIMLNLAIHSRMLRLHRPWLSRGYADERWVQLRCS